MSVVPHSLPDTLPDTHPAPGRLPTHWRAVARECGWLLATALAATAALALFVLVTELHTGEPLLERMLRPINLLRLTVMTGCLGLWSYILRAARRSGNDTPVGGASAPTRGYRSRLPASPGRG